MIKRIHGHAIEAGRTPDAVGLEPRLSLAEIPSNDWASFTSGWLELGATHLCINTMGLGYQSVDQHLGALRDVITHISNDVHRDVSRR
jgi:hypothetical protein